MRPLSLAPPQPARAPPGAAPGPRSRLRQTPVLIVATLVINLLSMALPIVILQVYDRVIPNNALATLLILVCGLGVAILIDALLRSARAAVAGWLAASHEHALGCTMVEALLGADLRTLEAQSPGVQLDRLGSVDAVRDFHASEGPLILVDLPFVVLFLALMYLIGGSIVVAPIVIAAVFGIVCLHLGGRLRFALTERSAWDDRRINFAIEILNGIHTIKAHAMENLMARRYERLMESTAGATRRIAFQSATAQNVGALFSQLSLAGVAAYGSVLVLQGNLTIGALGACTLLAGRTI
ncbi:MAG: ABC transporter permease, partial [Alphaproteobacteria bacterium]|nr:ABC transporter permease [Alphaproteobacteria bacterium]